MPEVRLAQERLAALLADDKVALDAMNKAVATRMTLRALSCSKNVTIQRFDSVHALKALKLDPTCFQQQDTELQAYYGLRTVGRLLQGPPLRPLKPSGPLAPLSNGKLPFVTSGAFARDAGVAVLSDARGGSVVVEMPGAAAIAQLPDLGPVGQHDLAVSPNGRVVALKPSSQGVVFLDAESGQRLWTPGTGPATRLIAWLPEVEGFIVSDRNGDPMLADGHTGTMERHPAAPRSVSAATALPGSPPRLLMGSGRDLAVVQHSRSPTGIQSTALRQYTLAHPGITSGALVPMKSGHAVVFASMRDIGWLDLDSGASDIWRTSPTFGIPFAKLDETHIMFDRTEAMRLRPTSFDIVQETVAPIDFGGDRGLIVPIGERIGFMRRDSSQAWFGDVATAGDAQPLGKVLADQEYQRQLAKLQAMSQATAGMPGVDGGPSLRPMPGLEGVPQEAEVHVVGVYEGRRPSRLPSMAPRQARPVQVILRRSTRPIVLVLASYEPVNWMLENTGATIASVLMSGYHDSSVIGAGNARVLRIGSAYAYTQGGAEYDRLQQAVRQYTGTRGIRSFQGRYEGQAFSVGGY